MPSKVKLISFADLQLTVIPDAAREPSIAVLMVGLCPLQIYYDQPLWPQKVYVSMFERVINGLIKSGDNRSNAVLDTHKHIRPHAHTHTRTHNMSYYEESNY